MFDRKPPPGPSGSTPPPAFLLKPPVPGRPSDATGPAPSGPTPSRPLSLDVPAAAPEARERKLIIGPGIELTAEIATCDHLVVEGTVEPRLPGARRIEIAEGGIFRGKANAEEADIGGVFDGELTVTGRLTIRAAGRIEGTIRYGALAVEAGGRIEGALHIIGRAPHKPGNADS